MADNKEISPTPPKDDSSKKPLTDEQEEALSKIMTDLEDHKKEETVPKDNDIPPSNSHQEEEDPNGLSDEQEAALERIMAEIEATSASKPDESISDNSITDDQEETLNRIVAELQGDTSKEESETPELKTPDLETSDEMEKESEIKTHSDETISEDLTPEQEETLQKIISDIDESSPQNDDSKGDTPEKSSQSPIPEAEKDTETKDNTSSNSGFEQLDLSDFESELQKVVAEAKTESVEEQKSHQTSESDALKKTTVTQTDEDTQEKSVKDSKDSKKTSPASIEKASEKTQSEKTIKEPDVGNNPPGEKKIESITPSELNQNQKKITIDKPKEPKNGEKEPEDIQTKVKLLERISTLFFKSNNKLQLKKVLILGGAVIAIIFIAVTTIRWLTFISGKNINKTSAVMDETQPIDSVGQNTSENSPSVPFYPSDLKQTRNNALSKILSDITELRSFLLDKLKEIEDLKIYYEQGISEVQEELIDLIRINKFTILKEALSNQKIELGLRTIQRRKGYIVKLDSPFNQVSKSSEELLYLERKANILSELMESTSGIGIDPFEKQVDESIRRISLIKENLIIDQTSPPKISLETIWDDLSTKANSNSSKSASSTPNRQNKIIWKEICSGNFDRKWALTDLNEKTANCLLKWNGKDLYLNQLNRLTPEVAQILSQWSGEWLGLNGLSNLSSEVAYHLASWKGKRLSLNGLSELSPKATRYLSKWPGDQLELIGLKHIGQWENPKTELFVSDKLRRRIPK
jgi:hypothetical protein